MAKSANDTHGIVDEDAEAIRQPGVPLFSKRVPIYPRSVDGAFRRAKWILLVVLLGIYYAAPWLRWDRGPDVPNQAILIDLPARRFYFFFIELWPQEVYYLTGILILMAIGLFFVTSMFGRVWCGYACPQTVWTDLYMLAERWIEGDRTQRMRLNAAPWSGSKIAKRASKHAVWLLIAMFTGGAWVFYFADAPTLARQIVTLDAPFAAWATIAFLTGSTYVLAGFAREQVCTYMCPYARFQAAMLDEDSLIVTYRADRGEPRGKHKKGEPWEGRGDCVDCRACVAVCPTGIDIRDGQQLECINCGLCVDACNEIMDKVDRPRGLIALDTLANVAARKAGKPARFRFFRPRTAVYAGLMSLVGGIMLYTLVTRPDLEINVLHDRNPLFVTLRDGSIANGYTIKVLNKRYQEGHYVLSVEGLPGARVNAIAQAEDFAGRPMLTVAPDNLGAFRVVLHAPRDSLTGESTEFRFVVADESTGDIAVYNALFRGPKK